MNLKRGLTVLAVLSLAVCLTAPVLHFVGRITAAEYKTLFLIASFGWFLSAGFYQARSNDR